MADHYDAALAWLECAYHAMQRARDCLRIGRERADTAAHVYRMSVAADRELRLLLWDIVDDMTHVRMGAIIKAALAAPGGRDLPCALSDDRWLVKQVEKAAARREERP